MRKVVVNSTPLIILCGIGRLDILKILYQEITIPPAVFLIGYPRMSFGDIKQVAYYWQSSRTGWERTSLRTRSVGLRFVVEANQ